MASGRVRGTERRLRRIREREEGSTEMSARGSAKVTLVILGGTYVFGFPS